MKKIKPILRYISQIFIIIGLPLLFVYGLQIHNEQIRMKDQIIETKEAFIKTLEYNQINSAQERYNALKEHHLEIANDLSEKSKTNDSLIKLISNSKTKDHYVYMDSLTARAIRIRLVEANYYEKDIEDLKKIIKLQDSVLKIMKKNIKNFN